MVPIRQLTTSAALCLTCGFLLSMTTEAAGHAGHATATAGAPLIAYAQNGNIIVIHADGTKPKILTNQGWNSSPHLSPDQRWVAFLGVPRSLHDHPPRNCEPCLGRYLRTIWIVHADGTGTYEPIRGGQDHELLSWSADSRFLAYSEGFNAEFGSPLKVRIIALHQSRTIIRARSGLFPATGPALAWSPDGRRLAIPSSPGMAPCPANVPVAIVDLRTWRMTHVSVHIPLERFSACPTPTQIDHYSEASIQSFTWTPDGRYLEVATAGRNEGGGLTGIWRVLARGGTATLVLGKPSDLRVEGHSPMLYGADRFTVSPNFRWIETDPGHSRPQFWVAHRVGLPGRYLPAVASHGCVMAQYTWLADSSGLAFVEVCKVRAAGSRTYSLFYRPLAGRLAKIAQFTSKQFDAMEVS